MKRDYKGREEWEEEEEEVVAGERKGEPGEDERKRGSEGGRGR